MTTNRTTRPVQLDRFIAAVMDPLPDAVLIDTQHNSMLRQQRRDAWRKAVSLVEFYDGLRRAADRVESPLHPASDNEVVLPSRSVLLHRWRAALVAAILTPAERKADVAWKRRNLRQAMYAPASETELLAAIAADEAFLTAHPVTRRRIRGAS